MRPRRRIAQVRLTRIALPVGEPWSKRFGTSLFRTIIRLTADDGTPGHAEVAGDAATFVRARDLAGRLIGTDALAPRVGSRMLAEQAAGSPGLAGAFEAAAIDLQARLLDAPLAALFGGRRPVPVQAAGLIDLRGGAEAARASAAALADSGYAGFALLSSDDPVEDAASIETLRAWLGPEAWLALIGDRRYRLADALLFGRATEAACLAFIADPVANIEELRRLRRDVRTPLASLWPAQDPAMLAPLLRGVRLDVICASCMLTGPFGVADLAANALAYQRDLAIPALAGSGLAAAADLHLASALRQVNHPVVDMTAVAATACLGTPPMPAAGIWRLPEGPGIGVVPDEDALRGHLVETAEVTDR